MPSFFGIKFTLINWLTTILNTETTIQYFKVQYFLICFELDMFCDKLFFKVIYLIKRNQFVIPINFTIYVRIITNKKSKDLLWSLYLFRIFIILKAFLFKFYCNGFRSFGWRDPINSKIKINSDFMLFLKEMKIIKIFISIKSYEIK